MSISSTIGRSFAAVVLSLVFAFCALAQDRGETVAGRYPAGSIKSIETADAALADISTERGDVQARYAKEEQACYPEFFASSCIGKAKERRRRALQQLRSIEIEANEFKRQAHIVERDAALTNKREKEEAEQPERVRREQEHTDALAKDAEKVQAPNNAEAGGKVRATIAPDRPAQHEVRLNQIQADEAAKAQQRAENVAAYEKKMKEAQARQKEVADRKAEKEEKRRLKEASQPAPQQ